MKLFTNSHSKGSGKNVFIRRKLNIKVLGNIFNVAYSIVRIKFQIHILDFDVTKLRHAVFNFSHDAYIYIRICIYIFNIYIRIHI